MSISGFSTHDDREDFLPLLAPELSEAGKIRPVHGKPPRTKALVMALPQLGFDDGAVPHREDQAGVS